MADEELTHIKMSNYKHKFVLAHRGDLLNGEQKDCLEDSGLPFKITQRKQYSEYYVEAIYGHNDVEVDLETIVNLSEHFEIEIRGDYLTLKSTH